MIKKILLIIILFCFNHFIFAQNSTAVMEVNYLVKYANDSLNKNKFVEFETTLILNQEQSMYFTREAKDYYDNANGEKDGANESINTSFGTVPKFPKVRFSVQKIDGKILVNNEVGKYVYHYEEPTLIWEILNQTKELKGYKCQLAKTKTDTNDIYFAWFTNEIAFQEGPFRFKGLSGLVLEVYNETRTVEFTAIDIKKSEEEIETLSYFNLIKTKSKMQFLEARKNYIDNPSAYNGNVKVYTNGVETTNNIKERLQKINVFLD